MTPRAADRPFHYPAGVPQLQHQCAGGRALLPAVQPHPVARAGTATTSRSSGCRASSKLDAQDLDRRFRDLSRKFHPDFYYNATPAERLASLERSSYLNDAYRALKQPVSRIEHLLSIEGPARWQPGDRGAAKVPPGLLEEVFALNEELDEIRDLRAVGRRRRRRWRRAWRPRGSRSRPSATSTSARWPRPARSGISQASRRRRPSGAPRSRRCGSCCSSATTSPTCSRTIEREAAAHG